MTRATKRKGSRAGRHLRAFPRGACEKDRPSLQTRAWVSEEARGASIKGKGGKAVSEQGPWRDLSGSRG